MNVIKRAIATVLPEGGMLHAQALDHYLFGEDEIRLLPVLCDPQREAIDAGANIGTYAFFMRRHARRVHAYEPNPGLANRLARLLPDVNVRQVALSEQPGSVVLKIPLDAAGNELHELASIAQAFDDERCKDVEVSAITIDAEQHTDIGFIKVDVEQHERAVLRGALGTIRRCRPVIMSEVSPLKYEAPLPVAFDFLLSEGYAGWFKFAKHWAPFELLDAGLHLEPSNFGRPDAFIGGNVLFFPREHERAVRGPLA